MIIFFDTETTGFVSTKRKASDPKQAHLVQIACQLVTPDDQLVAQFSTLVACAAPIHPMAEAVHGLSSDHVNRYGAPEDEVVAAFAGMAAQAEIRVAHNLKFDDGAMRVAGERTGVTMPQNDGVCTMEAIRRSLPSQSKNLAACIKYLFDEEMQDHHDAMADTVACRRIYFELKRRGHL